MDRRRRTRHTVQWIVKYSLGASREWRECRLVDLSETGATIEPSGPIDDESPSGEIAIQFQLPEDITRPFALLGNIRHMTPTSEGDIRLGVEFKHLTPRDMMLLQLVDRSHSYS
jgi:PilZ domain